MKNDLFMPSLIDRSKRWILKRSMSAWIFYVVFGIVLVMVQILFLWLEGGLGAVALLPIIIFNGMFTSFLLALIHLLDNQAVNALVSVRPTLDTTEEEFSQYEYKLSNMPFPLPLVAGLTMLILVLLMEQLWTVPVRYAAMEGLPVFAVVFHVIDKSSAFLFGVFIYHTIRQLRLVMVIHSNHVRVNLLNLRPIRAFSRLTASTAAGLVVGVYGWMLINPELLADPAIFGFALFITILAVSVFVWPLYGVYQQLEAAKESRLHEINLLFEAAFSKFNKRFGEEDYPAIEMLNGVISSLEIQHRRVKDIPTWPWSPETIRFALTTIALPMILAIFQFLVERALE